MTKTRNPSISLALSMVLLVATTARAADEKPGPAAAQAEKDKTGWKTLLDGKSLDGWKSAGYLGSGKIQVKDGAVILDKGERMTGLTYQRGDFPKMDYEVTLEGKRVAGDDFFCTTTFPVGDSFCSLVVGGWGGMIVGLSSINHMDASENETSAAKEFKNDQWYRIRIRVTKDRIQTWIDKEQVIDVDTMDKKISIRFECDQCKPFGIATWNTTGAIRDVRVRPLSEAEKKEAGAKKRD